MISHFSGRSAATTTLSGIIADVFAADGAEYLRMEDGRTIRLDDVRSLQRPDTRVDFGTAGG